jgi:spermidine synthase
MMGFPKMAEIVSPGKKGVAEITHYEVTKLNSLRDLMHGIRTDPGKIAILRVNGRTMMSDTFTEHMTNWEIVREARGKVLIAGLGLGMILHPILKKKEVQSVTVVEKYQDVIDLVSHTLDHKKLRVICADIFNWLPRDDQKFDTIYFDIWYDATNGVATPEKRKLAARFRRFKATGGFMKSWKAGETF